MCTLTFSQDAGYRFASKNSYTFVNNLGSKVEKQKFEEEFDINYDLDNSDQNNQSAILSSFENKSLQIIKNIIKETSDPYEW